MQQIALISTFVAVSVAQFGGYQPQQGNYGFGGGPQQQQQGGFMQQGREQWGQQGQQQQWGGDRGMMNGGMDSMMGGMGGESLMIHSKTVIPSSGHHRRGPPFLQNVTRQAVSEYYQIYMNRNLTKAQIQTAVGNWSTTYNVAVSSLLLVIAPHNFRNDIPSGPSDGLQHSEAAGTTTGTTECDCSSTAATFHSHSGIVIPRSL